MPDEREDIIERVADELRQPAPIGASFDARVMRVVRALPRHVRRSLWSRLTTPRAVTFTPLGGGLLAASLVLVVAFAAPHAYLDFKHARAANGILARSEAPAPQRVQFVLIAPTARKVAVVGDFNGWDATHAAYQAQPRGGGVWSVTAQVPVGHHRYSFVVDDSLWMADPTAPRVIDNVYGLPNSTIIVGEQNP